MAERIFRRKVWGSEVVVSGCNKDLHMRVSAHRLSEVLTGIGILIALAPVPLCVDAAKYLVNTVGLETQNFTAVAVERSRVRRANR